MRYALSFRRIAFAVFVGSLLTTVAVIAWAAAPPVGYSVGPPPENGGASQQQSAPLGYVWQFSFEGTAAQATDINDALAMVVAIKFPESGSCKWNSSSNKECFLGWYPGHPYMQPGGGNAYIETKTYSCANYANCTPLGGTNARAGYHQRLTACPTGWTLSGSTCLGPGSSCPSGFTPFGTSCLKCGSGLKLDNPAAPRCITDYESQCPYALGTGPAEWGFAPGQSMDSPACMSTTNPYQTTGGLTPRNCQAIPTGALTVCAGDGCSSDQMRLTGDQCTAQNATEPPGQAMTDCQGRDWCRSSGTCGTGYSYGTINGEGICAIDGKVVAGSVQSQQPGKTIAPPYERTPKGQDPNPLESGGIGGTDQGANEGTGPGGRVVVSIGGATSTGAPGGGGNAGTGSGGMGEIITCGLPNTPPCRLDETGTPTTGDFSQANTTRDAGFGELEALPQDIIDQERNTSWGLSFNPPTSCTNPPNFSLPFAGINATLDMCQWEPQVHAVMSFLWILFTLYACVTMVREAVQ